jgi:hypothetical protein
MVPKGARPGELKSSVRGAGVLLVRSTSARIIGDAKIVKVDAWAQHGSAKPIGLGAHDATRCSPTASETWPQFQENLGHTNFGGLFMWLSCGVSMLRRSTAHGAGRSSGLVRRASGCEQATDVVSRCRLPCWERGRPMHVRRAQRRAGWGPQPGYSSLMRLSKRSSSSSASFERKQAVR